jgi:hypothetical protein
MREKHFCVNHIKSYGTILVKGKIQKSVDQSILINPSNAFGHSDRKNIALAGRHNFVTSILRRFL